MSTQIEPPKTDTQEPTQARDRLVLGVMLILIGLIAFLSQVVELPRIEWLILPALALIFLIWGLIVREIGLIIPGGILAGVALGTYLITGPLADQLEMNQAGVFLVAFSAGWALISLLSPLTKQRFQWWPLIPGGIIGMVGLALLQGGAAVRILEIIGYGWPLILIGVGVYLLLKRKA